MASYSPTGPAPISTAAYPISQHQSQQARPRHRRMLSESEIVQPKPMFRKFCLDVLSATLLSPSVILLSLKYIQQLMINLKESNKIVNTGDGAEYRFFTGALILANKFLDDNTFTNKTWADITGMKIKDVNHLEMQFLNGIDFRLFTSSSHYSEWLANLTQFTSMYMPSQHPVACQQQAAAAQSPISPMDHTSAPVDLVSSSVRPHGSGSELAQNGHMDTTLPLSMASISSYIDSVKQLQHRNVSTSRYQRTSGATAYSHHIQAPQSSTTHSSQQHYISLPQPSSVSSHSTGPYRVSSASYTSSPTMMPYTYQQGAPESIHRKRSAIIAFEDAMENAASYDSESLPHSTRAPVTVPSHKRFSSSSSATTLMGIVPSQDMFRNGSSPLAQQHHSHESSQQPSNFPVRNASQSTTFRGHHQRSASLSYYVDMGGYSTSYRQDLNQIALPMPNTFSRAGAVHPLERDQDQFRRPSSRADSFKLSQAVQHHGSQSTGGASTFQPATPPQYSSSKCESSCYSMGCDSNVNPGPSYDVDPRLWGPLDSLSLYAITTQAAKRVVAHSKALSSSANGLHMYYPTTLA
ncbi:hypothetical protein EDD11_004289 [Mortierella claussenii]|nr:hypothetical protein EDD11_004289 [Mortierella claussenii]